MTSDMPRTEAAFSKVIAWAEAHPDASWEESAQNVLTTLSQELADMERELANCKRDLAIMVGRLSARLQEKEVELASVLTDWNALVKASGSPTNGGAIGYVANLKAEREGLREVIYWALGERGPFPDRPEGWDKMQYKPWYWWRTELRQKLDAAIAARKP